MLDGLEAFPNFLSERRAPLQPKQNSPFPAQTSATRRTEHRTREGRRTRTQNKLGKEKGEGTYAENQDHLQLRSCSKLQQEKTNNSATLKTFVVLVLVTCVQCVWGVCAYATAILSLPQPHNQLSHALVHFHLRWLQREIPFRSHTTAVVSGPAQLRCAKSKSTSAAQSS